LGNLPDVLPPNPIIVEPPILPTPPGASAGIEVPGYPGNVDNSFSFIVLNNDIMRRDWTDIHFRFLLGKNYILIRGGGLFDSAICMASNPGDPLRPPPVTNTCGAHVSGDQPGLPFGSRLWVSIPAPLAGDKLYMWGTVPEPATWAMMLLGFAGLGFAGYRSRKAAPAPV
jgi:hypothetical protein